MKFNIKVDDETYEVEVEVAEPETPQPGFVPASGSYQAPAAAATPAAGGGDAEEQVEDESKVCRSPVTGVVIRVDAEAGQDIEEGDTLMVLEAMKMETVITAPIAGKIARMTRSAGEPVKSGQVLIEFE